ncbi:Peptidyl-prolyl cis-trans isomerase A [Polaribacter huanghezhanensis]|uniref:peptidylprolyl isomerase n=1 Tax=Polaribacter huanghezhanensis TaxID=1354726 RepID=UPI00264913D2|nr:peptidylprolyl isomerase [Polaribacter huanghezhanensis]WKD85979.1 Peptidyl-prolyl cis-trans isomerase A [Polaribacter huanghezhanensis]
MKRILFLVIIVIIASCAPKKFNQKWLKAEAPNTFKARFETTKGNFDIVARRAWSPKGVDRLYQLIKYGYYDDVAIFRVVPNFVAQFGIHNDTLINNNWRKHGIDDEPVLAKNEAMSISFARGGVKTRSNQIFINLKDNHRLDELAYSGVKGFPVIAKVIAGKENVLKFYDGYGDTLGRKQDSISQFGNAYLREKYPKVDYIIKAYFIK